MRISKFASAITPSIHSDRMWAIRPTLEKNLAALDAVLAALSPAAPPLTKLRADLAAVQFHLRRRADAPVLLAILGGTGTGKSTLLNRLLGADLTATSFRRTFTAGPIAVVAQPSQIPAGWLAVEHETIDPSQLPARGTLDRLTVIAAPGELTSRITLIDTPDLDGDQPAHHAQADRVFRWADAVLFLVTPEKYQMTELLPYYRLARRYGAQGIFVMNKVEQQEAVDDYSAQVEAPVYAIARDDAAFEPAAPCNLEALRQRLLSLAVQPAPAGSAVRAADLMDRLRDQAIEPMRLYRKTVDQLIRSLRAMETPAPGVDVNPLTQQLQRRLQHRSVLYLMGPGRVLDRVRQVPGMLARLPRTTWDLLRSGRLSGNGDDDFKPDGSHLQPDFRAALVDQFNVVQSRIEELLRSQPISAAWTSGDAAGYAESKIDPTQAGQIATEEIANLQSWLEQHWNATPRDTAMLQKLLKLVPGGASLTKWSEAAPYLLTIVVATHHAFFGPVDLMILGGYSLATWLTERLSNQVSSRTRQCNNTIAARFTQLVHRQIDQTCQWLGRQAPAEREIDRIASLADQISEACQEATTA